MLLIEIEELYVRIETFILVAVYNKLELTWRFV